MRFKKPVKLPKFLELMFRNSQNCFFLNKLLIFTLCKNEAFIISSKCEPSVRYTPLSQGQDLVKGIYHRVNTAVITLWLLNITSDLEFGNTFQYISNELLDFPVFIQRRLDCRVVSLFTNLFLI